MIVTNARVAESCGSVHGEVSNAKHAWTARRGLWLGLSDDEGRWGQGEASPLPGYSADTFETARCTLESLAWQTWGAIDTEVACLSRIQSVVETLPDDAAAARFAVESALLDLVSQATARPVAELLGAVSETVSVARLVAVDSGARALAQAEQLVAAGAGALKVKIGRAGAFDRELSFLRGLRAAVGPGVALRLDANGCLGGPGLAGRLSALAALSPEFLEEPAAPREVLALDEWPIALALDESLHGGDAARCVETCVGRGPYRFVVLKPMLLGGVLRSRKLAKLARGLGARAVVSHAFDGPIGWSAAAALAFAVHDDGIAAGLGPHGGLAVWPTVALPGFAEERIHRLRTPGWGVEPLMGP